MSLNELELQAKYMENSHKIINSIDNGTLKNSILKEIAPAFYMSHREIKTLDSSSAKPMIKLPSIKTKTPSLLDKLVIKA